MFSRVRVSDCDSSYLSRCVRDCRIATTYCEADNKLTITCPEFIKIIGYNRFPTLEK